MLNQPKSFLQLSTLYTSGLKLLTAEINSITSIDSNIWYIDLIDYQADLGIEVILALFNKEGLEKLFATIATIIASQHNSCNSVIYTASYRQNILQFTAKWDVGQQKLDRNGVFLLIFDLWLS